ncbi:TolC family protein [Plebeiibacterium sediminum]|uniref:TolC family protein n=1 Tax=Plebeiibacterium sediminum TaxID=2992112 RepID=A0AAE3M349_9BACT|nr:TolC family protein [Plebeiobacterium sediminum]MCW3785930.1 TolC family protein [Plebeiobacterium sediminum]
MKNIKIQILTVLFCILSMGMQSQNTLSLSQAIEMGLQNNYDLKVTRNNENIASINNNWGNTGALPTVSFSAGLSENLNYNDNEDYRTESLSPQVSLNWLLFDGFSARITKKRFEELENLSKGNTVILVENTIQDIISAYNNCIVQQELVKVYDELMSLSEDRYNRELSGKEIGVSTTYESLLAKTSWLSDKSTYLQQKVSYENSIRTLNFILGIKDNTMWQLTSEIKSDLPDYTLSDLSNKLISNNTTLKNQYINQTLLSKETALAKSNYLPTISLNGGVSQTNRNTYFSKTSANDTETNFSDVNVGLNISYTIFNGGQRKRSVQIAKIEEESGLVEIDQMKHSLQNQLMQIFSTYEVQKELVVLANEQEEAAKLNMDMAEEKLKNGSIDSFDFRAIQINYLNAAIQKLNATYNVIESQTALTRITGGIVDEY